MTPDPEPIPYADASDGAYTSDDTGTDDDTAVNDTAFNDTDDNGADDNRDNSSVVHEPATRSRFAVWRAVLLVGIALVVLALDIVTKILVVAAIAPGENIRVLGGLVYLTLIHNSGAAFGMATGMTWLLAIVAIAVVAFIIWLAPKLRSTPWAVCLALILGGALGNLTDRIFRAPGFLQGHVVDFVSVFGPDAEHFPAFNVADSAITVGGVLLVVLALLGYDYDGTRIRRRKKRVAAHGAKPTKKDDDHPADGPASDGRASDAHG